MAGCLEVAEHLNHINEQHLSYWCKHFLRHGYKSADLIRPKIWDDPKVEWWYRQNIVLFAAAKHPIWKRDPPAARDMIHPELHRYCCWFASRSCRKW